MYQNSKLVLYNILVASPAYFLRFVATVHDAYLATHTHTDTNSSITTILPAHTDTPNTNPPIHIHSHMLYKITINQLTSY